MFVVLGFRQFILIVVGIAVIAFGVGLMAGRGGTASPAATLSAAPAAISSQVDLDHSQ